MNTTSLGSLAEAVVSSELQNQGHKILAKNWKTRLCEIDVIASKEAVVYFVEVKYRSGKAQGEGIDYITPKKLKQLKFAAKIWVNENGWEGDYRLLAASVSGKNGKLELEDIIEIS